MSGKHKHGIVGLLSIIAMFDLQLFVPEFLRMYLYVRNMLRGEDDLISACCPILDARAHDVVSLLLAMLTYKHKSI